MQNVILAGTRYGEIVYLDNSKLKLIPPKDSEFRKYAINTIEVYNNHNYACSSKMITSFNLLKSEISLINVSEKDNESFIQIFFERNPKIFYATAKGVIGTVTGTEITPILNQCKNESETGVYLKTKKFPNKENQIYSVGKSVLPVLTDLEKCVCYWRGKNVPNDELSLQVPIYDMDALIPSFEESTLITLHRYRKIRTYDIRHSKTRPQLDIHLKDFQNNIPCVMCETNKTMFTIGSDNGDIMLYDLRQPDKLLKKLRTDSKGASITSLYSAENGLIYSGSLDGYIRQHHIESNELEKIYAQRPITALKVLSNYKESQLNNFKENKFTDGKKYQMSEIDCHNIKEEEEDEEFALNSTKNIKKKGLKQLRKRNKVGLAYLAEREFPEPDMDKIREEMKQEAERLRKIEFELNPIDKMDIEMQEHAFPEESDSEN